MALNKPLPRSHLITHQHIENLISLHRLLNRHLQNRPLSRIHRRIPQSLRIHLPQTLVAANLRLLAAVLSLVLVNQHVTFLISINVLNLLPPTDMEERRLRYIHVPLCNQLLHVAEEESEQERANMCTVNISVAHNDDTPVAQFCHIELLTEADADSRNNILDLLVFQHLVQAGPLDIEDLTSQGQDGLEVAAAALLGGTASRIALHQVELTAVSVFLGAVGQFPWQ